MAESPDNTVIYKQNITATIRETVTISILNLQNGNKEIIKLHIYSLCSQSDTSMCYWWISSWNENPPVMKKIHLCTKYSDHLFQDGTTDTQLSEVCMHANKLSHTPVHMFIHV